VSAQFQNRYYTDVYRMRFQPKLSCKFAVNQARMEKEVRYVVYIFLIRGQCNKSNSMAIADRDMKTFLVLNQSINLLLTSRQLDHSKLQ
jgi:hypothetical protein